MNALPEIRVPTRRRNRGPSKNSDHLAQAERDMLLIRKFLAGDGFAFKELVNYYRPKMLEVAYRMLHNESDAEDVTQDALVRMYNGLAGFRDDSAFSTWLFTIVSNLARNRYWYWFRRKKQCTISMDSPPDPATPALTLADVIPAPNYDPAHEAIVDELLDRIAIGMNRLQASHREILVMRNIHFDTYAEIGRTLGINVGTVKSRIARARGALRRHVMSEDDGMPEPDRSRRCI